MTNAWKITTIALVGVTAVVVTSSLTTAYLSRVTTPADAVDVPRVPAEPIVVAPAMEPRRPPIVHVTRPSPPTSLGPVADSEAPADPSR
jgi:hypothetical protein